MSFPRPSACLLLVSALLASCATYTDDLDRATRHYNGNRYDNALALLEVLERDLDSLPSREQARYAYYRGMTHFRLQQRRHARHWLGRSAALDKKTKGALAPEENKRVSDTLDDLNKDVYGTGNMPGAPAARACVA
ncbi:hypothetical protein JYT22_00745, partial [Endomicrobium sp. AH-315-J14]|nr:hypothetical protein [Endomicrobium sp. AH-315-J14]